MKTKLTRLCTLTVLLTGLSIPYFATAATVYWSGVDALANVNTNWSDANNWSGGVPGAANSIIFDDAGAVGTVSNINNIVDVSTNILTLKYGTTNGGFHTTLINPGVTLTVSNNAVANLVWVGTAADNGADIVDATMTGVGGHLVVISTNVGSVFVVQQGTGSSATTHKAILDLSGLDTFNLTAGRLLPGGNPASGINASNDLSSLLVLAKTNVIQLNGTTTPTLNLGDAISNGGPPNTMQLGQTNSLFIGTMTIAHSKASSTLQFNPNLAGSNPVLYLRGTNAATRVATLSIGDNSVQTTSASSCNGTMDLSLGTVDAQVNTCYVGRGMTGNGSGTATGTLTLGAGVFNASTLFAGFVNTNTAVATVSGTVNVNAGGTLVVTNNLVLGANPGATATAKGTLNITNGTVWANAITSTNGTINSTINMSGGTLVVSNTAGTSASPITAMNLVNSATLQIPAGKIVANVVIANVAVGSLNLADSSSSVINVSSLPVLFGYPSQFPLISYTSFSGGGGMNLGTLPGAYQGFISNDMSSTIWVVVTNGPSTAKADEWGGGVNNLWNTTTLNWTNAGVAVSYSENDSVTFDDLGRTGSVNLVTNHTPLGLIVTNNALNYTFTGVGSITGVVGLTKQGSASLTLAETGGDNFSGGMVVGGGTVILEDANCAISGGVGITNGATLQIGNNDANGAMPTGSLDDEGTLVFSRTDNLVLATAIAGGGGLTQNGSGTLTLSAPATYTGNTIIAKGSLALTNSVSLSNSVSVLVSNAAFDVSGLNGQTTVLNSLAVTNATFKVAISGLQPPISVVSSLTADGIISVSNKINVLSLPILASYPVTFTVIQSAGISLTAGNFNFVVGSLPASYAGFISESPDTTSVLLTITNGPVGVRPAVLWNGADVAPNMNTNWSDRLNWQLPGVPTPADNVIFNNTAAVSASVLSTPGGGAAGLSDPENFNNIVDTNFTVSNLSFTNANSTYHNTAIVSGATLTITNTLTVGAMNLSPVQTAFVTVAGAGGTLNVATPNAPLQIWNGNGTTAGSINSQATLDLSALDNFNATVSQIAVGSSVGGAVNYVSGILYLAKTNNLTSTYQTTTTDTAGTEANAGIVMGDCIYNAGLRSYLYLGQANTINADTIAIGRQKASGTLAFNSIYPNIAPYPWITIQGLNGNPVSLFEVGGGANNTGTTTLTADANLTGGFVTATINKLNVGVASTAATGAGTTTGTLEFDAGTISASTVNIGLQTVANTNKVGVGTISVNANPTIGTNATLSVIGNLNLAVNVNSPSTTGTLDVNGGTVQANSIVAGLNGAVSTVTVENNGTLVITNVAGTPAAPLTTLNLNGGTLQLNVNGTALVTNVVATTINTGGATTINIGVLVNVLGVTNIPLISYTGNRSNRQFDLGHIAGGFRRRLGGQHY